MSIPSWLFDELAGGGLGELEARCEAWSGLLEGAVDLTARRAHALAITTEMVNRHYPRMGLREVDAATVARRLEALEPLDPTKRVAMMRARAAREHEACAHDGCECDVSTLGPDPTRCGRCFGLVDRPSRARAEWERHARDAETARRPAPWTLLCPGETDEDRLKSAGGRDFSGWKPYRPADRTGRP